MKKVVFILSICVLILAGCAKTNTMELNKAENEISVEKPSVILVNEINDSTNNNTNSEGWISNRISLEAFDKLEDPKPDEVNNIINYSKQDGYEAFMYLGIKYTEDSVIYAYNAVNKVGTYVVMYVEIKNDGTINVTEGPEDDMSSIIL